MIENKRGRGRPKGSISKYSGKEIISKYNVIASSDFLDDLLRDLIAAREAGDRRTLVAYQTLLAKFVFTEIEPEESEVKQKQLSYEELVHAAKLAIAAVEKKEGSNDPSDKTTTDAPSSGN